VGPPNLVCDTLSLPFDIQPPPSRIYYSLLFPQSFTSLVLSFHIRLPPPSPWLFSVPIFADINTCTRESFPLFLSFSFLLKSSVFFPPNANSLFTHHPLSFNPLFLCFSIPRAIYTITRHPRTLLVCMPASEGNLKV
jgi:hypothetical protein